MSHDHRHDRVHGDRPIHRPDAPPPPGPASILDIGGDVGAVVVRLAADTASGELWACRRGEPASRFHTGVHLRPAGETRAWIAVFPEVVAGPYSLLTESGIEHTPFDVRGGEVTALDSSALPDDGRRRRRRLGQRRPKR